MKTLWQAAGIANRVRRKDVRDIKLDRFRISDNPPQQVKGDTKRERKVLSVEDARIWQNREREDLRKALQ